jgi:hypothetical protein
MSWTKAKPTAAGWYWYRGAYDVHPAAIQKEPVIVFVETDRNRHTRTLAGWQPFLNVHVPLSEFTGEWSGPLPEPVE